MIGCDHPQPAFVIGVVRDSSIRAVGEPAQPHLYRRFSARDAGALVAVLLDTKTDPARLTDTVRRTLLELAPGIRVYTVQPLGVHVARSFGQLQWITGILIGLGVLALLLAAVGLYGAIAYRVSLRTREIGLRMAVGATRLNVFRSVVGNTLAIVVVGVAIGELLTTVLTGIVASVRENIGPTPVFAHVDLRQRKVRTVGGVVGSRWDEFNGVGAEDSEIADVLFPHRNIPRVVRVRLRPIAKLMAPQRDLRSGDDREVSRRLQIAARHPQLTEQAADAEEHSALIRSKREHGWTAPGGRVDHNEVSLAAGCSG